MSPKRKTKKTGMFVIFVEPAQYGNGRNSYIALDGKMTKLKVNAAKFYSHAEAQQFAKDKKFEVGAVPYVGREDFKDSEV